MTIQRFVGSVKNKKLDAIPTACWQNWDMATDPAATEAKQKFAQMLNSTRQWYGSVTGRPNLTMDEFAGDLGIQSERYRRWERAETEPSVWLLASIRRLTGVSLDLVIAQMPPGQRFDLKDFPPQPPARRKKAEPKGKKPGKKPAKT